MPVNPYIAGNPVGGGNAFVGRADVLRDVARVLRSPNENALVLYGQRRIGKTSILQELLARLPEIGPYQPVYFDLQGKAVASLKEVLAELAAPWGIPTDGEFLPLVLDHLPPGESLVVLLDEYGLLDQRGGREADESLFIYLKDLLRLDPQRLQFIFVSGQRPEDMPALALSIFKGIKSRPVSLLSPEETAELVRLAERNGSLKWPDETVEYVYSLTGGHPFLTQQLCQEVWEQAYYDRPSEPPVVQPEDVDRIIPVAMRSAANALEWVWAGLGPAERVIASALARLGPGEVTEAQFSRGLHQCGVRVMTGVLQNAVQMLLEWDIIGTTEYGFYFKVELLRRWIASRKSLTQLQDEVCRIDPVADSLYQEAYRHYQKRALKKAEPLLQQAIGLNPNHIHASQLLAEILLAEGELYRARQILESLAEYFPAVHPRLVQALLLQAREANPDERLALYNRILQLDPNHPEALEGRRRIWLQRGDDLLAAGNALEAMSAYRRADVPEKIVAAGLAYIDQMEQAGRHLAALDLAEQLYAEFPSQRHTFPPLLAAEVLLSRREFSLAITKLRGLYPEQPDRVRPLLVQALFRQAQMLADENEQLALYEEILRLDPQNTQAQANRRRILSRRAQEALQAGRLDQAVANFQAAGLEQQATRLETQLRRKKFEDGLRQISVWEQEGNYHAALEMAHRLVEEFPEFEDDLPDLEQIEKRAWLDKMYRRACAAVEKDDLETARSLFTQVISVQPDYREALRYLYLLVAGVDVADIQHRLEESHREVERLQIEAKTEAARRRQMEEDLRRLQEELETERISRRETERFAQQESTRLRQQEKELQKLQSRLETEAARRQEAEARAAQAEEAHFALEKELSQLQSKLQMEREARERAEALARNESEARRHKEKEAERLRLLLTAEKKDAVQQVKFAEVRARRAGRQIHTSFRIHRPKEPPLSPWNPLHLLQLLWWLAMAPQQVQEYKRQFGANHLYRLGKWWVSMFIWLPLFFPTLAMSLQTLPHSLNAWPPHIYIWLSAGMIVLFFLTGWLADTDDILSGLVQVVIAFSGALTAAYGVVVGLSVYTHNDVLLGGVISLALLSAVGLTFIVQGESLRLGTIILLGVAIIVMTLAAVLRWGFITDRLLLELPAVWASGLAGCLASTITVGSTVWFGEQKRINSRWFMALFNLIVIGIPGMVSGLVAGIWTGSFFIGAAFGLAFSLANTLVILVLIVFGLLLNGRRKFQQPPLLSWAARAGFGFLTVVYLLLVWQVFLGGWQIIGQPLSG